jgi:hypothetical protein
VWRGDGYTGPNCSVFAAAVRALLGQLASVAGMLVKSLRWGRGGSELGLQLSDDASVGGLLTVLGVHAAADPDRFSCICDFSGPLRTAHILLHTYILLDTWCLLLGPRCID